MLLWPLNTHVYLYVLPTDMRRGFDSLRGMARDVMNLDPMQGHLFLFLNKRRTHLKLLWWQRDSLAIYYRRLERGTFQLPALEPELTHFQMSTSQLALILEGIDLTSVRHRTRYTQPTTGAVPSTPMVTS